MFADVQKCKNYNNLTDNARDVFLDRPSGGGSSAIARLRIPFNLRPHVFRHGDVFATSTRGRKSSSDIIHTTRCERGVARALF